MSVHPRRATFRGIIQADGLWFDLLVLGEATTHRRVVSSWLPGSQVHRAGSGLLLMWPSARTLDAARAPGSPVVRLGASLSTAPLSRHELDALDTASAQSLVIVQAGECEVAILSDRTREDPSTWIDLTGFTFCPAARTIATPPQIAVVAGAAAPRNLFGVDPIDGPARVSDPGGALNGLRGWLTALRSSGSILTNRASGLPMRQRLLEFFHRLAGLVYLRRIAGRQYARHLANLLRSFEEGDLDNALRNAIALGRPGESLDKPHSPARPPRLRPDLSLDLDSKRITHSVGLETRLMEQLRLYYRSAFEQLQARGRFDEAAFVLTELLQAHEEAVAFLERHGRLEKAAQLAEARGLNPGLVVRQWFIAGNQSRACLVARRTGAFAEAVALLERGAPGVAHPLRQAWAEHLAKAGNYAAALEAAWPAPQLRALADPWLDRAISVGGAAGARALVWKISARPDAYDAVCNQLMPIVSNGTLEGAATRWALAKALGAEPSTAPTRTLMRPVIRSLCGDVASGMLNIPGRELRSLIDYAADACLHADLPGIPASIDISHPSISIRIDAADTGLTPLSEAVWLPNGEILVATGEGGCRLIDRDGAVVARFGQPATKLVLSDQGTIAITLAWRDGVWKLGRLDLAARSEVSWCETSLDDFAPDFDGSLWFVGIEGTLHALDATSTRLESIWHVPDVGIVGGIDRDPRSLRVLLDQHCEAAEEWQFQLPNLTLRHRVSVVPLPIPLPGDSWHWNWPAAAHSVRVRRQAGAAHFEVREGEVGKVLVDLHLAGTWPVGVSLREDRLVVCDNLGRLLAIDLKSRRLLRNLRI